MIDKGRMLRIGADGLMMFGTAWFLLATGVESASHSAARQEKPAKPCAPLKVDIAKGTVNGLGPATPLAKVKKKLPCFTGESAEGELFNYGGGVFYLKHNMFFYTYARFTELREPFNGAISIPIFGRHRADLMAEFGKLGTPGRPIWGTAADEFVTTRFGCIQVSFHQDRATRLRFFTRPCGDLKEPR